jgi:hypothetical protein
MTVSKRFFISAILLIAVTEKLHVSNYIVSFLASYVTFFTILMQISTDANYLLLFKNI